MKLDFNSKCQIEGDIKTIEHLLSLNPFCTINDIEIQKAILTRILICLRDLLYKTEHLANNRINFIDDVKIDKQQKISDVTDLIKFMRDALCHEESKNHNSKDFIGLTLNLGIIRGKCSILQSPTKSFGTDYEDDICFITGSQKLYLNRHIIRAFNESKTNLLPLLNTRR